MIRVMAEKGGLVGLNYCAGFLDDQPAPTCAAVPRP